jgi:hypothetical protein
MRGYSRRSACTTFATAATLWLAAGESIYFVQQELGYADIQTTSDQYGHPDKKAHREAAAPAADWWGEAVSEQCLVPPLVPSHIHPSPTSLRAASEAAQGLLGNHRRLLGNEPDAACGEARGNAGDAPRSNDPGTNPMLGGARSRDAAASKQALTS